MQYMDKIIAKCKHNFIIKPMYNSDTNKTARGTSERNFTFSRLTKSTKLIN